MKHLNKIIVVAVVILAATFASCKKTEQNPLPPTPGNEFMTTIKWRFQNVNNPNDTVWCAFRDSTLLSKPYKDTLQPIARLHANTTYSLTVHIYDETQTPTDEITSEIGVERANYHTYWLFPSSGLGSPIGGTKTSGQGSSQGSTNFALTPTDKDTNNPPIWVGLSDKCVTGSACTGTCEGVLRHQPNAKNGTFAPGSSDSDVTMKIIIQ